MKSFSIFRCRFCWAGKLLLLVVPVFAAAELPATAAAQVDTIKILTFNIMWEEAGVRAGNLRLPVWEERKSSVAKLVTDATADIVGFQEASPEQQLGLEAELPEYTLVFHAAINNTNPILFKTQRFKLLDSGAFVLNTQPEFEATNIGVRSSTWVHLQDRRTQRELWVYNLHLDHRSKGPTRQISAVRLMERLKQHEGAVFVTGDFNTSETSPTMAFFHGRTVLKHDSGELVANPKPLVDAYRFIHPEPSRNWIDHVLVGPGVGIQGAGHIVTGSASDHNIVWTEVVLQ